MTIVSPPPRVFHALLQMVLSADGVGDEIARDLGDEFERDFREVGRRIAGARYRRRVVEVALYYVWDHVRGRTWARSSQGRPSPAPQRDLGSEPRRRLNMLVESLYTLHNDVRIAVRMLVKRPGFAAILTVTIALGVGANVTIFTLVNEILLRPLPIGDPQRVVEVYADAPMSNGFSGFSYPDFVDYRDRVVMFAELAALHGTAVRLGDDARGQQVSATFVTRNYFDVLEVRPVLGRAFLPEETVRHGANAVTIVSHGFWQRVLGGRTDVLASPIRMNGAPVTVVGILPEGFSGTFIGFPVDVWLPLPLAETQVPVFDLDDRSQETLEFIGRLRPGISALQASAALDNVSGILDVEHPIEGRRRGVGVAPATGVDHSIRRGVIGFLGVLMAVTGIVLLLVCLNVGNMLMAHAAARRREMATRLALGARRTRLLRQLLVETLVVFMLGGVAALFVSDWATDVVASVMPSSSFRLAFDLSIDWRVWTFAVGVTFAAACATVLVPARETFTNDPISALRATGGQDDRRGTRLRSMFVVAQVMGAVDLMASAGLFLRSVQQGTTLDPGYDAERVFAAVMVLPDAQYDAERRGAFFRDLSDRLVGQPEIESVALAARPPIGLARSTMEIQVPAVQPPPGETGWYVEARQVGEDYFATLGVSTLSGRVFDRKDYLDERGVAIVNATMARQFWGGSDPVGQTISRSGQEVTIVGVVADTRYLIQDMVPGSLAYLPWPASYPERVTLLIRAAPGVAIAGRVQDAIMTLDATLPPPMIRTVRQQINASLLPQRAAASVISLLGVFGLLLASLGVYGVLAHAVERRKKEIAIRMAVGGHAASVVGLFVRAGLRLVLSGLVLGTIASLVLTPLLRGLLVGVEPSDPLTFASVLVVFLAVAVIACLVPAYRAVGVDPATALRSD